MEDEPFIRAILAAPDNDLPRLVYADYLDETGRAARAEFIRLQIESARLPPSNRRDELAARAEAMIEANRWQMPSGPLALVIEWRRGFEYKLDPATRGVFNGGASLAELAQYPTAEEVKLGFCCTDDEFQHMPDLPNLRRFYFGGNAYLSDASVPRIARWCTLRRLEMQSRRITDEGLPHLAPLTGLTALDLSYTRVTDDGLRHLTALRSLEELNLYRTRINGSGLHALAGLPRLRQLTLGDTPIAEHGLGGLVGCALLEELDLSEQYGSYWDQHRVETVINPLVGLLQLRILRLGDGFEETLGTLLEVCRQMPAIREVHFNGERLI